MPTKASTILKIRKSYSVSAEVAGRSLARKNKGITVIGLLWRSNPRTGIEGMRVVWSEGPKYVPIGARLNSSIVNSAMLESTASGIERLNISGLQGDYSIDAVRPIYGDQVIAVVKPIKISD